MKPSVLVLLLALVVSLLFTDRSRAAEAFEVTGVQMIHDREPFEGEYRYSYTFEVKPDRGVSSAYYEMSFFDSQGKFLGYTNGNPSFSDGHARCMGTAYLTGLASSYEFKWQTYGDIGDKDRVGLLGQITTGDMQWTFDPEAVDGEYRHEYSCKASGAVSLGQTYYEVAFFGDNGEFLGFTNGTVDFSSLSTRFNGTAYLQGQAKSYEFVWQ